MRHHLLQELQGQLLRKRVKNITKSLQDRLQYMCTCKQNGEKSMQHFLEGVGHIIDYIC